MPALDPQFANLGANPAATQNATGAESNAGVHCFEHEAMSTAFEVYIAGRPYEYARQASAAAFREIDRIEDALSRYVPSSDIGRINLLRPGQFTRVGMETFECLQIASLIYGETGGAFDVTVGPLVDCCRTEEGKPRRPHEDELDAARNRIGMDQIVLWAGREAEGDPNDRNVLRRILRQAQSADVADRNAEAGRNQQVENRSNLPVMEESEVKEDAEARENAEENEDADSLGPINFWVGIAPDIRQLLSGEQSPVALSDASDGSDSSDRSDPLSAILRLDLGAIGKGYALDKAAEVLREWSIADALIHAGTSTAIAWGCPGAKVTAGVAENLGAMGTEVDAEAGPAESAQDGWPVGIGGDWVDDPARRRILLKDAALSGSGTEVKGSHILDGRAARPAAGHLAAWATYPCSPGTCGAAVSDALSTAFMVMRTEEVKAFCAAHSEVCALTVRASAGAPALEYFGNLQFLPA